MGDQISVYDLHSAKGRKKWVQVHVLSGAEAAAAIDAGVKIISCRPDHTLEPIRAVAPNAFISAGFPHGSITSPQEAIRGGFAILERGASAVYCSHSTHFVEAMAREGIPVTGHVGLVPNRSTWTNFRAVGRTPEEALKVLQDVKDLENAGAACLEVEVIPVQLADYITRNTPLITMGMGCGDVCDTQYLFSDDILGTHEGHYPRHSKTYADFVALEAQLQAKRVEAFQAFAADVENGAYPERKHEIHMEDSAFEKFLNHAEKL